jgi:hypothetical protein
VSTLQSADRDEIRDAVHRSFSAEFATLTGEKPTTFPLTPFYDERRGTVIVTSPPAYAGKVDAVRSNPHVSLLLHGATDRLLVRGRATVHDDDLRANADYLDGRIEAEPVGPKRTAFLESRDALSSRLGRALFDWYALRIVVEIDPVSVERVPAVDRPDLRPWHEIGMDADEAASYDRATFTVVDGEHPSIRPVETVSATGDVGVVDGAGVDVEDGQPACLLAHWHDDTLSRLGQRLVRGRCRTGGERVRFDPGSSFTLRNDGLLDAIRFVVDGKRRTRAYFDETSPFVWRW